MIIKNNILLLIIGLLYFNGVQANLEYLEYLNLKAWNTHALLNSNETKTLKEESRAQPRGFFGKMYGQVFGTLPKNPPQMDLNELAQIFATLNVADISTLLFLNKNCNNSVFDPMKDPNLCEKYPEILIKQVQNRLDVVNTKLIRSKGSLKCPPNWLKHTISATEILKEIDIKNQLEYKFKEAVTKAMLSEDAGEDEGKTSEEMTRSSLLDDTVKERAVTNYELTNQKYNIPQSSQRSNPCFSIQLPLKIISQPIKSQRQVQPQSQTAEPSPPTAPAQTEQEQEQISAQAGASEQKSGKKSVSESPQDTTSADLLSLLNNTTSNQVQGISSIPSDSTPNVVIRI